jgi:flagellin
MGLRINQNVAAMNAYRNLTVTDGQMSKSLEKLSSGFRINRAADDAAGLSISEGLRAQVGGTKVAIRNAQDGISVVQTAEGALSEVHSILQRMRDLAVQAANTGSQDPSAVAAAQTEVTGLTAELDRISSTTSFGATKLLDGTFGAQQRLTGSASPAAWSNVTVAAGNNEVNLTFVNSAGANQTVNVTLNNGVYTSGAALANEANRAINAAISAVDPTKSGSVAMSYKVDPGGAGGYFELTGSAAFTTADSNDATNAIETHFGLANATSSSSGTGGKFQVGANTNAADQISISISSVSASTLGVGSLSLSGNASGAITSVDTAIATVSTSRASLGAYQNRFEHTISNLSVAAENLSASESRIRDTDMAQEMLSFTRAQILTQAGTAMLAQANQAPQQVLQLLRG